MPIIQTIPEGEPLSQGDILKDIRLFATGKPWDEGGEGTKTPHKLCMVLSRPCVAIRKSYVIVAAIEKYKSDIPRGIESFDDVKDFLETIRDGSESPDVFYLGQLPGETGRFNARLGSLHTIEIPIDGSRQNFVDSIRIARLDTEFQRDLHVRLTRSFASMGFDDCNWYSTDDLNWLVKTGGIKLGEIENKLRSDEAEHAKLTTQGFKTPQQKEKLETSIATKEQELEKYKAELKLLQDALESRS